MRVKYLSAVFVEIQHLLINLGKKIFCLHT